MKGKLALEQSLQKTYYDHPNHGPTYSEIKEVPVIFLIVKKGGTNKFTSFKRDTTQLSKL